MGVSNIPVITVDGPSGTGKGTIAMRLQRWLGWNLLDSGALYRLVAHAALAQDVDLDAADDLAEIAEKLPVRFDNGADAIIIELDGTNVTDAIRTESCGIAASMVAALPSVRAALLHRQREFRLRPGLIADGRDMGTVVFPTAELKIFLTASPEERAQRRYKQLKEKGMNVNLARLLEDISQRDRRDQERAVSPLKPALDAIILDTSKRSADEVEAHVKRLVVAQGLV